MKFNKNINIFIISSFVSIITLTYIGIAYNKKKRPSTIPYVLFSIFIPLLYGVFGLINYNVIKSRGDDYSLIVGMVFGLLLSIIGRFKFDLPIKLFGFTKETSHKVHLYAMILYAIIFRWIMTPLVNYII